jgi:hypothetical protein
MKRFGVLCMLVLSLLAFQAATPEASGSWGCGNQAPQCTFGGPNSQCDRICGGAGLGVCVSPGCCECIA